MTTKRLGRGLADLLGTEAGQERGALVTLRTEQIRPGKLQPRQRFDETALEELKASIAQRRVIEPVLVRPAGADQYELVAGERRWRALQQLGIQEIPAVVRTLDDREALVCSLIENLQREELNALEEAHGYARLLDEFGCTQEDIASAIGKDRTTVANLLRLLRLPEEIQHGLVEGMITAGHARALLAVEPPVRQLEVFRQAAADRLTVREIEELAVSAPGRKRRARRMDPQLEQTEQALRQHLGTKVRVLARKRGGRIVIEYFSTEELTRLLEALGIAGEGHG
jgi:ParB family chromosome partitioning protein